MKDLNKKSSGKYILSDLIDVMRALRTPETGCPWDLEQNFQTIIPYTLEEAYEVADAVDRGDMGDLREELGDLLFQSVYHAQMASEVGAFDLHDVVHDITEKMISRHPHVFGDMSATSAQDVDAIWDEQKSKEKPENDSALNGVTAGLPSLLKAQKLQKKAAKAGFEWKETSSILDKLEEEIAEMRAALKNKDLENQAEELGDILFLLANYGRSLGINAEEAVRQCNNKFERRFRGLESDLKAQGTDLSQATLEQMSAAWDEQKLKEKKSC
ncbi:MAG: nucleoside triphosphate pyrophosphohydrolase [Alphaproteobacteria bacterium]